MSDTVHLAKAPRRPRWDRIIGALLLFVLCVVGALALSLLRAMPRVEDIGYGKSDGLRASMSNGWVVSFVDPGVSLNGLHHSQDVMLDGCVANSDYAWFCLPVDAARPQAGQALARFDAATGTLGWLCDLPGCDHQDPSCRAWLPDGLRGLYLDGDSLYFVIADLTDNTLSLQRSDLDGANRRELFCLQGESRRPCVLYNRDAILLIAAGDGRTFVYEKATGDFRPFMTLKRGNPAYTWDHYVTDWVDKQDGVTALVAVDLASGLERTVYTCASAGDGQRFAAAAQDGGFFYYLRRRDAENCDFVRQSIATGEEVILSDHAWFPENYTAGPTQSDGILDGCYLYSIAPVAEHLQAEAFTTCCLDLETGEARALPPSWGAKCRFRVAFGEVYLVNERQDADPRDFYLIPRTDYETGRENYAPIQDDTR